MVNGQWPNAGNKLFEEHVRFGPHGHMATVFKEDEFFLGGLDGGKILLDQLGRGIHVRFALKKEHWLLEPAR